jgi:hypothetical protein
MDDNKNQEPVKDSDEQTDIQEGSEESTEPGLVENPDAQVVPSESPDVATAQVKSRKKLYIIIAGVLVVVAIGVLAAIGLGGGGSANQENQSDVSDQEDMSSDANEENSESTQEQASETDTDVEIVSSKFKNISPLTVFSDASLKKYYTDNVAPNYTVDLKKNIHWYEMGTEDGVKVYLLLMEGNGLGEYVNKFVFTGTPTNLTFIEKQSSENHPVFASTVKIDSTTELVALKTPDTITVEGADTQYVYGWDVPDNIWSDSSINPLDGFTEVGKTPFGTMYEKITTGSGNDVVKSYVLQLEMRLGTFATYRFVTSTLKEDQSMPVTFDNGDSTNYSYRWDTVRFGCGSGSSVNVLSKDYHKDLVATGTVDGQTVYEFKAYTHPAVSVFYDSYVVGRKKTITQKEYFEQHNLIAMKNELGYYVLLGNSEFQPNAECAKPVIYLYPETQTYLSVKVGADVTKSEPLYNPTTGWRVLANPNGTLLTPTGVFDSLFWDGTGFGVYPNITSGTVVKQEDVRSTIVKHLGTMGLNNKEISDFLEYWMPLMPDTTYIRLSWLTTDEMNKLAPLELSVKPDTMIRVFLDFEGSNELITIPTQKIPHFQRSGFTLVEWGGLRIGD